VQKGDVRETKKGKEMARAGGDGDRGGGEGAGGVEMVKV